FVCVAVVAATARRAIDTPSLHDALPISKNYRAAGYRSGWMILSGAKHLATDFIEGLNILASMRLCANVPAQWAVQTALGGYQSINDLVRPGGRLDEQRTIRWERLTEPPGVLSGKAAGARFGR